MCCLVVALLLGAAAGLHDLTGPWETGPRGTGAIYTDRFVAAFVERGIVAMQGIPGFVFPGADGLVIHDWHHPPLYWLYLALVAEVLGHEAWVLRFAHLVLWLPSIAALFVAARAIVGPVVAGFAALLHVALPMTGYFGPMLLPEGAVTTAGLITMWLLWRYLEDPSRGRLLLACAAFLVTTQLDFTAHFWGVGALVLALWHGRDRTSVVAVLALLATSVVSIAIVALHYGILLGGPLGVLRELAGITGHSLQSAAPVAGSGMRNAMDIWLTRWIGLPHLLLAGSGLIAALLWSRSSRRAVGLALAIVTVGAVSCALLPRHAIGHAFWPMQGMAGVALLAAFVPATGVAALLRRPLLLRLAGALLCLGAVGAVVQGTRVTHCLVGRHAVDRAVADEPRFAELRQMLAGCAVAISYGELGGGGQFVGVPTYGSIDTLEELEFALRFGALGLCAYVLPPDVVAQEIVARLEHLCQPQRGAHWIVYRFRL